jgi:beta-galactosidase beta subunit
MNGSLLLKVYEQELKKLELNEDEFAIVGPRQTHSVKFRNGASFKVDFYRVP